MGTKVYDPNQQPDGTPSPWGTNFHGHEGFRRDIEGDKLCSTNLWFIKK